MEDIAKRRLQERELIKANIYESLTANTFKGDYIEKAVDPSHGGKLKLTHIVDKNGHHRMVWTSPEQSKEDHKHVAEVKVGDKVNYNGQEHTVHAVKTHGYVSIKDSQGKKSDRSLNKLQFHNPLSGEITQQSVVRNNPLNSTPTTTEPVEELNEEEIPVDYEKFGTPAERMGDWENMITKFADDDSLNLTVAYGTGGVGKTFSVLQNVKLKSGLETGEVVKFTGGTTAAGFFEMLYDNRDKKIILDDFDLVLKDPQMLSLLSNISLNTGKVMLDNPKSGNIHEDIIEGKVPPRFEFTGKIMLISNVNLDKDAKKEDTQGKSYAKILQNSESVNLRLTTKETWDLMNTKILHDSREMINGQPNPNFGGINKNLSFQDSLGNKLNTTDDQKREIAEYFAKNWNNMEELSGRTLTKANAIREQYTKKGADWKKYANMMLLKEKPEMSVNERFDVFNDSLEMIKDGLLKSAVIVDTDPNSIVNYLNKEGIKEDNNLFKLIDQMNVEYIPKDGENIVTDTHVVIGGAQMTERKLFETLAKHNGKIIIFNKNADNILGSALGQGLLKGALDTSGDGDVSWLSSVDTGKKKPNYKSKDFADDQQFSNQLKEDGYSFQLNESGKVDINTLSHPHDMPQKFAFKGRCIFLTDTLENAPQPIRSRSMLADITAKPEEFLERSMYLANHRERSDLKFSNIQGLGHEEYRNAVNFLNENKDRIDPMHLSEAGIIKVANHFKTGVDESKKKSIMRQLIQKGLTTQIAGIELDLTKAFENLL